MKFPLRFCCTGIAVTCTIVLCLASVNTTVAAEFYRDQMNSGAGWGMNVTSADTSATFGYDYSADFIPEAPNSRLGDAARTGVKLQANILEPGSLESFAIYPLGKNFTGNYRLRFDAWANYDADMRINGPSNGTTEFIGGGISYDSTSSDVGSGVDFLATNDGGSGSDWRVFNDNLFLAPADMAAGDRNGSNVYYTDFLPGVAPPAGQSQVSFPDGFPGAPGFQWLTFELAVINDAVRINIEKPNGNRLLIAAVDTSSTNTNGNIALYYADYFTSVTSRPDLTFGIIDNVVVDSMVPEPASISLILAAATLLVRRRRRA